MAGLRDSLEMHGDEPSRVLIEVHDRIADNGHRRHLELHFYQLRIEQFQQNFVNEPAIHFRHLETLVVKKLLDARFGRHLCDAIVLIGRCLDNVEGGGSVLCFAAEGRHAHLSHTDIPRPRDCLFLVASHFPEGKVGAGTLQACVFDDLAGLFCVSEAAELGVTGRTELDGTNANGRHIFAQSREIAALDSLTLVIRLASYGQGKRIGLEGRGRETGGGCARNRFV